MTTSQTNELLPKKPLRVWPGVVALALLLSARFGLKAVVPGFEGFRLGMMGALMVVLAIVVWWAFFSRAAWFERLGAIVLMIVALGAAWLLKHESMGPFWLFAYAIPILCLAFVAWAVASRRHADRPRRATMVATILLVCGMWTLVRTEGITGDHVGKFAWRWTESPEERLIAQGADEPPTPPPAPVAVATPTDRLPTQGAGEPAALPPAPAAAKKSADWPGFRGLQRDGIIHGVRIETNWTASPPVELWRRPIGPSWSSFAVRGNLLYTQEQRGNDEVVACYNMITGRPVWTHRDSARFFESNAGAGPRATPTLSNGRVYTFGATGILNSLDASNGAVVWSRNAGTDTRTNVPIWGFSISPLVVGDIVVVAAAGQLAAYDLATGNPRWFGPSGGVSYSSPHHLTIGGVPQILMMSESGAISVAATDGKRLWDHPWPGVPIVQPALTPDGDVLIVASGESGTRR